MSRVCVSVHESINVAVVPSVLLHAKDGPNFPDCGGALFGAAEIVIAITIQEVMAIAHGRRVVPGSTREPPVPPGTVGWIICNIGDFL
jgi:hypothetical protein